MYVSADATVDFNPLVALQSSYGNDTYVGVAATTQAGRYTTAYQTVGAAGAGAGSYVGLYTYMVLVNTLASSVSTPENIAGGTYYAVSSISAQLTQYDTPVPGFQQSFTDASDANGAAALMKTSTANIAVPEPSTVALMLAGLGIVAMRMRRK